MTTAYDRRRCELYVCVRQRDNGRWSYSVREYDVNTDLTGWETEDAHGRLLRSSDAALEAGLIARDEFAFSDLTEAEQDAVRRDHAAETEAMLREMA